MAHMKTKLGIITGTGLEDFGLGECQSLAVETRYGRVTLEQAYVEHMEVYLLPRHGRDHAVPPHRINYRANIAALRDVGCTALVATNAVGSLREHLKPGDIVLPDQFIDCTKARESTFFDGDDGVVEHVDMTDPYCPTLRGLVADTAAHLNLPLHSGGTYLCTEGPRFETPAEIRAYAIWGADLVGMTGVPEVVLAREASMCYTCLCLVTNYAAGIRGNPLTGTEIGAICHERRPVLYTLLQRLIETITGNWQCQHCQGREAH